MNAELHYWLDRSGLAKKELARRVRARARSSGLRQVCTSPSRIRGWLAGQRPAGDVAEIVAEVLSDACAEALSPARLGFDPGGRPNLLDYSGSLQQTIPVLTENARSDLTVPVRDLEVERRSVMTGPDLISSLRACGILRYTSALSSARNHKTEFVTMDDVEQLQHVTGVFREWDNSGNGGLQRKAVVGQLVGSMDRLAERFPSARIRRKYFLAVADLAQLAGWMSYDLGFYAVAHRYYMTGLRLSAEAGDTLQRARMLYCMARQLIEMRRADDALDILDMALCGMSRATAPRVETLLLGMKARAFANRPEYDPQACEVALESARRTFATATDPASDPAWISFYDESELAGVIGATYRDLAAAGPPGSRRYTESAVTAIREAIHLRSAGFGRSRALDTTNLAHIYLLMDEPGLLARYGNQALDLMGSRKSTRVQIRTELISDLAESRFPQTAELRDLHERVNANRSLATLGGR
jgi:hypothetical protein